MPDFSEKSMLAGNTVGARTQPASPTAFERASLLAEQLVSRISGMHEDLDPRIGGGPRCTAPEVPTDRSEGQINYILDRLAQANALADGLAARINQL